MSFEGFKNTFSSSSGSGRVLSNNPNTSTSTMLSPRPGFSSPLPKSMFSSSFPLSIKTKMEGRSETGLNEVFDQNNMTPRANEEGYDNNNSGSDNLYAVGSAEDQAGVTISEGESSTRRRKRFHRHTPEQIQELEAFFKACPHPDEKQRLELSQKLSLESRQVKFWFQNRRTQMKTQSERHENIILKQENEKLSMENRAMKEALGNPTCKTCGGLGMIGELSHDNSSPRVENARLKAELHRVQQMTQKFLGKPTSTLSTSTPIPNVSPGLELGVGMDTFAGSNSSDPSNLPVDRSMLMHLAFGSLSELLRMFHAKNNSLWTRAADGSERLNYQEYSTLFPPCLGSRPGNFVPEASRETGLVCVSSLALVETLMDVNRWKEMFPCLLARAATTGVVSSGIDGTRNGTIQLMQAEMHVLSGFVPVRQVTFVRFCKNLSEGVWAVVDVSVDSLMDAANSKPYPGCRKLPSGCVLQDMPNACTKVTWIEHWEYDESSIHPLYRPLIGSGMGFGATRWLASLQRQCESWVAVMSSDGPGQDHSSAISSNGKKSMLKLMKRMMSSFCSGISGSSFRPWEKVHPGVTGDDTIRLMTRKIENTPGEPGGIVLSATTSRWLPVSPQRLFDFLQAQQLRSKWDILTNGGSIKEMLRIPKGCDHGNVISLLRVNSEMPTLGGMLILQETWIDASGAVIVYAPVDLSAMQMVLNGGDSATVSILPSGFAILPDGNLLPNHTDGYGNGGNGGYYHGGSLLTVGFQILVNSQPKSKINIESVQTVNNLIHCTVEKIKVAMQCP